jgi:hypothetical protein
LRYDRLLVTVQAVNLFIAELVPITAPDLQ